MIMHRGMSLTPWQLLQIFSTRKLLVLLVMSKETWIAGKTSCFNRMNPTKSKIEKVCQAVLRRASCLNFCAIKSIKQRTLFEAILPSR
jgi:hypothetical protein